MSNKLFNALLLFSLFGISLGFFGVLYEGVVVVPKMLDHSMQRMMFWRDFYTVINPVVYYLPVLPLATIVSAFLYFNTPKEKTGLKKHLMLTFIFQIASLIFTFYIVTQINPKMLFSNIEKYADEIPAKTTQVNILSVARIAITAIALRSVFNAYITARRSVV